LLINLSRVKIFRSISWPVKLKYKAVSLPTERHEMTHTANAGATKLQVHSSGASQASVFLPLLRRSESFFSLRE